MFAHTIGFLTMVVAQDGYLLAGGHGGHGSRQETGLVQVAVEGIYRCPTDDMPDDDDAAVALGPVAKYDRAVSDSPDRDIPRDVSELGINAGVIASETVSLNWRGLGCDEKAEGLFGGPSTETIHGFYQFECVRGTKESQKMLVRGRL